MTLRDLTIVTVRCVAIWLIISTITGLSMLLYTMFGNAGSGMVQSMREMWLSGLFATVGAALIRLLAGVALFIFAPAIARLVCRGVTGQGEDEIRWSVGAGDLYQIAAFVLGVFLLSRAISPSAQLVIDLMRDSPRRSADASAIGFVETVFYVAIGLSLILGARGIARFLSSLGHDPHNVPAQQISLRVIMAVVIGIAVLMGAVRMMVR